MYVYGGGGGGGGEQAFFNIQQEANQSIGKQGSRQQWVSQLSVSGPLCPIPIVYQY